MLSRIWIKSTKKVWFIREVPIMELKKRTIFFDCEKIIDGYMEAANETTWMLISINSL
jgi:hypothetical protein